MPDEEGYLFPGELGGGGYGAIEGDLGPKLRPLAGFGRDLADPDEYEDEEEFEFVFIPEGFSTGPKARYVLKGWT